MEIIENIAYISGILIGLYILLLAYGIVPSNLDKNDLKMTRILKVIGFFALISSIVRLMQIWL
jgi:hypothetical protein